MTELYNQLEALTAPVNPLYILLPVGFLFFIIFLVFIAKSNKRKSIARRNAPDLVIDAFQVSPLGRDASLRIKNHGEVATITHLQLKGRHDLKIKNWVAGQQLEKLKANRMFLEAQGINRIDENFMLEVDYTDRLGNQYRQVLPISKTVVVKNPKLLRYS